MRSLTRPVYGVVFDMDGLLLDTERLYQSAIVCACGEMGFDLPVATREALVGITPDKEAEVLSNTFGPAFDFQRYDKRCSALVRDALGAGVPLREGALALLNVLSAKNLPAAVATSSSRETTSQLLSDAGIHQMFKCIVTRDDVRHVKPDPAVYLQAAELLGIDPRSCLALEDTNVGAQAAIAARMQTIIVPDLVRPAPHLAQLGVLARDSLAQVAAELSALV